jgi:hypothetical protein
VKVWITKYALTHGIYDIEAELCKIDPTGSMISDIKNTEYGGNYYHNEGREWHRDKESAVKRAEEMRIKKIGSLMKRIAKLQKLNFEKMVEE